jgi:hypothetical protein
MATTYTPVRRTDGTTAGVNNLKLDHLSAMLTGIGFWQHTMGQVPDVRFGYSIDDEARGLIVALQYLEMGHETAFFEQAARICFRFVENAAIVDKTGDSVRNGRFHNFCDLKGAWLDKIGSDDSLGRTIWGLGVAHGIDHPLAPADRAETLLRRALSVCETVTPIRSKAFMILGLSQSMLPEAPTVIETLADSIADSYAENASLEWRWFEDHMTYCNARLSHALLAASLVLPSPDRYVTPAVEALDFLIESTRDENGYLSPIGNAPMENGRWFKRTEARPPMFDQQPVDAGALVECCALAYEVTGEPRFRKAAHDAYAWYFGDNVHGLPVYDESTGGVYDALTPDGVNLNMGAESVLSIHLAAQALQRIS